MRPTISIKKDSQLLISDAVGVCVRDENNVVMHQNERCHAHCGPMVGRQCETGCQAKLNANKIQDSGYVEIKDVFPNGHTVNALVFNDKKIQVTLLFDMTEKVNEILEQLKPYALTETETSVIRLVLSGHCNQEVANKLGIEKSTVKTHINKCYKKIPAEMKNFIQSRRASDNK